MNEIICPNCKKAFKVDEAGYAAILKQVRDHQFQEELKERLGLAEKEKLDAVRLAEANLKNSLQEDIAKKESEISALAAKIQNAETEKKLSVAEAIRLIEKERDHLANDVRNKEIEKQLLEESLKAKYVS